MISTITKAFPDADPRIIRYAEDAAGGKLVCSQKVRRICEIFLNDLGRIGQPDFAWVFDAERASRPIRFMEKFIRPTGDYDRMVLMGWQCFIEGAIFGWVHRETGLRKHRKVLIVVGSGNGKTPLVAGTALYCASQEGARNPEIDVFANSREQAGILVGDCAAMVSENKALQSRFKVLKTGGRDAGGSRWRTARSATFPPTHGRWTVCGPRWRYSTSCTRCAPTNW